MMTQTHMLIAAAVFTRPDEKMRNSAAMLGGVLPDLALYSLLVWGLISGLSLEEMFSQRYWSPAWQAAMSPGNSAPAFLLILAIGYGLMRGGGKHQYLGAVLTALGGAALAHIALDFPLHVDDGHTHLWPLSDWKFVSPVSYWDPAHFGNWVRPVELLIGIACLIVLFRRFKARWVRVLTLLGIAAYVIEPLVVFYFFLAA